MMMKNGIIWSASFTVIFTVLSVTNCTAQMLSPSARGFAMGDADVADPHDVTVMYSDPASLASLKSQAMYLTHVQERDGTFDESFALPMISSNDLAIALSTDLLSHGFLSTKDNLWDRRFVQLGYEVGAATVLTPVISAGGAWIIQFGGTDHSKVWATNFSGAINYSPTADINYSLAFDNIGRQIQFSDSSSQTALASGYNAPANMQVGIQMGYPSSVSLREPMISMAFDCQKFFNQSTIYYKVGVEVLPIQDIALRLGYIFAAGFDEFRTGFGFTFWKIRFDYGIAPRKTSEVFQMISASFDVDK
jgi:hypothetical protein